MMIIKERKGLDHHHAAAKLSIVKLIRMKWEGNQLLSPVCFSRIKISRAQYKDERRSCIDPIQGRSRLPVRQLPREIG